MKTMFKSKINQAIAYLMGGGAISLPTMEEMDYWTKFGQMASVWIMLGIGVFKFIQGYLQKRKEAEKEEKGS